MRKNTINLIKSFSIILVMGISLFFLLTKQNFRITYGPNNSVTSECLKLTEQFMPAHIQLIEWDAADIDKVNEIPVSVDNTYAKILQESVKETGGYVTNYGPFIMEKTLEKGGKPVPETNPDLIECYKNKIQIGMWR